MSESALRLIVGLGNPGPDYRETRHNVGFWFIDRLIERHAGRLIHEAKFHGRLGHLVLPNSEVRLLQPMTFVNRSGQSVAAVMHYFDIPVTHLLVVHDEMDLPLGQLRLKQGGGHAGHNGLRDIMAVLGSNDFWRVRIGIDHPLDRGRTVDHVLSRPDKGNTTTLHTAVERAADGLNALLAGQFVQLMNQWHTHL